MRVNTKALASYRPPVFVGGRAYSSICAPPPLSPPPLAPLDNERAAAAASAYGPSSLEHFVLWLPGLVGGARGLAAVTTCTRTHRVFGHPVAWAITWCMA